MDLLTDEQIDEKLAGFPGWTRQGDEITHTETLADFRAAMLYVGAIAYLAEAANHHPDIGISWIPNDDWSRGKCGLKVLQYMAAGLPSATWWRFGLWILLGLAIYALYGARSNRRTTAATPGDA